MAKFRVFLILVIYVGLASITANSQTTLQSKIDLLIPGKTNLEQIKKILGEPESQTKRNDWWGKFNKDKFYGAVNSRTSDLDKISVAGLKKRTLYYLNYPSLGITLSVFDNPWKLLSIEVTNEEVSVFDIKIADKLEKVETKLGKGKWNGTRGGDDWWLEYEDKGVRFVFLRDMKAPQSPMKLAEDKAVVKIEKYDNKVSFIRN